MATSTKRVGHYQLGRTLGEGTFAKVRRLPVPSLVRERCVRPTALTNAPLHMLTP